MNLAIYGAKSLALGIYYAIKKCYPEHRIQCFLVTSKEGNPGILAGLPVKEAAAFSQESDPGDVHVLIGTPEDIHEEIRLQLKKHGYVHYTCMDSRREAVLMEQYFEREGRFLSIHSLDYPQEGDQAALQVFMAKFYRDRTLAKEHEIPPWICPLQVGAALTDVRTADLSDNTGRHISEKNVNYCELTALYWMWKNRLETTRKEVGSTYFGLFHYRRILEITEADRKRMWANEVDVVLPFPTLHEPDIREHHARYVRESDWEAMLQALKELQPEYAEAFSEIEKQPYLYNYNLVIAKSQVLKHYCEWLFPILERTEELSVPRGWERSDRYIGYLGENLLSLYFLFHRENLRIFHTGRWMLT